MGRAPCCDKANVKRGPWSPDEDATLKNYLEKHGTGGNWIALPHKAGLRRCGKSCRLRWLNYLRPDIKHGGFTEEEDNIICTLYNSMGSRWSVIASQLPGRTDNDVKNYWNTKLKKKLLTGQINAKNNNINDTTTNTTRKANLPEFSSLPTNPKIESYNLSLDASCSTTLPPLMDMGYQQPYCNVQRLILDRSDQLPLTSPMEVPNFGTVTQCNSYSTANITSSQEISGLSMQNSHVSCLVDGSMIQDEGILLDFGFDQSPYELPKGFGF